MDGFIELANVSDMQDGDMRDAELEGHKLLIARVDDDFFVADGHCPHMGGPLAKGHLEGTVVTCPWHKSQYDLRDGSCLRWTNWKGAVLTVAELARHPRPVRVYETRLEGQTLWVGPQKPPGKVPDQAQGEA